MPRYAMLETVREFAAGRLRTMPDAAAICAAHAAQFGHLARDLARPPCWPARDGLDLLELEHDNFRAALDWYRREDPSAALRLANRLTAFWSARRHFSEGRRRLAELLELDPDDDPERLDALNGAAWLATDQGDRVSAIPLLDGSIERARGTHDVVGEATALYYRGRAKQSIGDPAGGGADIERALELQTGTADGADLAAGLWWAGASAMFEDDLGLAIGRFERCAELSEALGLPAIEARALQLLGVSRLELGDLHGAKSALGKGVPAIADIGDRFAIPVGLSALAGLAAKGDRPRAALRRPALRQRMRRSTDLSAPEDPRFPRRVAGAGVHDGRRGGGEAVRRGARAGARLGNQAGPGRQTRGRVARRPVGEPYPQ